ncbi:RNA polymerase sigma factor [Ruminococcus flavefaciens]|jgi:RNA polymerase sigma-70 factor (ECF subfamily)|uniref:RNA polymerase sigma factor n=1 Tax=Ruminococcus flavefaciens TaxID=1265 RepID=UPI000466DD4B|nr:RNA polymerase sigma factor [Ruminococcus flavefaciens]
MDNGLSSYSRFLSGDKDAIDEIIRDYKDGLVYYLYSIIGDIYQAEEAAIDAFVKLYVEKPAFKGTGAFKTWLYTIGRNKAIDIKRKFSRFDSVSLDNAYDISGEENIEQKVIEDERRADLRRLISKLKPEYSQVLYLIFFEDFKNDEAAKIMNRSSKQIRDLLYRAKNALKKEIEQEGAVFYGL